MAETQDEPAAVTPPLPDGEYAIAECLGHRTLIGRVAEVERFGTKMLQIEPIFRGKLLSPMFVGGGSLYAFTPCTKEVAAARAPTELYNLPGPLAATLQPDAPRAIGHRDDDYDASGDTDPIGDDGDDEVGF